MPSEKDCHARLAVILSALAMDPKSPDDESLKKYPSMKGMFTGVYLMKPDTDTKNALKEIWQNNYEVCKEHLVPLQNKIQ